MELESIVTAIGGGTAVGGFLTWAFKTWVGRVNTRLDKIDSALVEMKLAIAENKGKDEGQKDLVWREINTDKHKIAELQASTKKIWELLSKMAPERSSDRLASMLEKALAEEK